MIIRQSILLTLLLINFYGCQTSQELSDKHIAFDQKIQNTREKINHNEGKEQQSYIKVLSSKDAILDRKIENISINNIDLRSLLNLVFPNAYIITEGKNIDLKKPLSLEGNNINYAEFLELLSSLSTYRINLEKANKIVISSVAYRRWNVASLVSLPIVTTAVGALDTGAAGNSTGITISKADDVWADLLSGLEEILGSGGVIVDNRRLGEIYASGNPDKLVLADQWMKKIVESSTRQVLLDVAILEVTLNDGEARGLDWNAIYTKDSNNSINLGRTAVQTLSGAGTWDLVTNYASGKLRLNTLVNLLKQHGKVSVQHQPSLTVTNGSTAYLGASEQFSYLAGLTQERTTSTAGVEQLTTTPDVQEINIGVNIAVTARLLEDDNILIEVVPVISSLQGFDEISFLTNGENQVLRAPKISLQELSTQVITKSGQAVHLGGLIIERLTEESAKSPIASNILNLLTSSQKEQLEKREILVIITPTEV